VKLIAHIWAKSITPKEDTKGCSKRVSGVWVWLCMRDSKDLDCKDYHFTSG